MNGLSRTPLHPIYEKYGGKTIDFGGWELPVQFAGIKQEHETVRTKAGLFDVSHMGEFIVKGPDATGFLQVVTTNDLSKLKDHQAQYSFMCYPDGGTVDDLLVYKFTNDHYMLVVNAANREKDFEWLQNHMQGEVSLDDVSDQTALLALQGPSALTILEKLTDEPIAGLQPFSFIPGGRIGEITAIISRTGYTGEDGFELYLDHADAVALFERLMEAGAVEGLQPIGLGARDTLRFEARLPLYGQELSPAITPIEAGMGFAVKIQKEVDFIGKGPLTVQKQQGASRKTVGIEMIDRGIPRSHYPILDHTGEPIGEVTSGTQSPTLKKNVGIALLDAAYADMDSEVWVEIRGKKLRAKVVSLPFYSRDRA